MAQKSADGIMAATALQEKMVTVSRIRFCCVVVCKNILLWKLLQLELSAVHYWWKTASVFVGADANIRYASAWAVRCAICDCPQAVMQAYFDHGEIAVLHCILSAASTGDVLPLAPSEMGRACSLGMPHHRLMADSLPFLPVGTGFFDENETELLRVTGRAWLSLGRYAAYCPLLTALTDIPVGEARFLTQKKGRSLAWITLSDKGSQGLRIDKSGPAIASLVRDTLPLCHEQGFILPDERHELQALVTELSLGQGYDLICTSGGTGLGPRDITPQTIAPLLEMELPGFAAAMLMASLEKTPHASISRAVCGVLGGSIIITLPGSQKAVVENLSAILPALPHALDKLHGDPADCGG